MPPPWIENKDLAAKNLAAKTVGEKNVSYPMGDFRFNEQAKMRKLDSLMGIVPKQERKEFENPPAKVSDRPKTQKEEWEALRTRALKIGQEQSQVAMKRDGAAWVDEDGYTQAKEPPAFREGFNNTLRVKPAPDENLHNWKQLPERLVPNQQVELKLEQSVHGPKRTERPATKAANRAQSEAILQAARDQIQRLTTRADITAVIGEYFVKAISTELSSIKPRNIFIKSSNRSEVGTASLNGGSAVGVHQKSLDTPELDGERLRGEIELLLRAIETLEAPQGYVNETASAEAKLRSEQQVSRALGNAFVSLGMTLPAGPRDDPLRNDSVALNVGSKIMAFADGGKTAPKIEQGLRTEVAVALGRAMLHLRAAASIEASRGTSIVDKAQKDRTFTHAVGKLTLQLLESTAARSGKTITKDPLRREVLAKALGAAVVQLEAASTREHTSDRGRQELDMRMPSKPSGPPIPTKAAPLLRLNKPHEVIVNRPILPGRDAPPPTVPRFVRF